MRRTRRGFTQIYLAATKNFAVGNLFPAMHHAAHENRYHYRPRPFGIGVRRFWLELLFEFHSRATAAARARWRYLKVFAASGYTHVVGAMQLLSGLLLLIGRFVPIGLTILAAILFNIWTFHLLMAPAGLGPAMVATLLWAFLVWSYRERFVGLLQP